MDIHESNIKWFRSASAYINAHRGRTFVLMLGSESVVHESFANLLRDLVLLNSLNVKLVVVYGARAQINAALAQADQHCDWQQRLRATDATAMSVVRQVVGDLRMQLEAGLTSGAPQGPGSSHRVTVTGGNFVLARPAGILGGVDMQFAGRVRRVDASGLRKQLEAGAVVLLGPVGYSRTGEIFNLCYAEVAAAVASALRADKLIALSQDSGLRDEQGALTNELSTDDLQQWLQRAEAHADTDAERLRQARAMLTAVRSGVPRAHMVSFARDGALISELFSRDGCGSQVVRHATENCRRAHVDDVPGILALTTPLEASGELLPRSRQQVELDIENFHVLDLDGSVIACAAFYLHAEDRAAEIACVATHEDYQGDNRARRLVKYLEDMALRAGLCQVFVLTTQAAQWFEEQGYRQADISTLPASRQQHWTAQRNSLVLMKELTGRN